MDKKKDNVVALGWRHVIRPAAGAADAFSIALFVAFVCVFILGIEFRFHEPTGSSSNQFYLDHYGAFWYGAWALLVLSTVGPLFNLTRERNEVPLGVLLGLGIIHLALFIVISGLALTQDASVGSATALLAATAGAGMVGIGWVVQHQSGARASRRTHTFNILMQSRLSVEFQKHVDERRRCYPAGKRVSDQDATLSTQAGLDVRVQELRQEFEVDKARAKDEALEVLQGELAEAIASAGEKHKSLRSMVYLLNFYEFLCAGIICRELDERMIKETLVDIAVSLYEDSTNLRLVMKNGQPAAFCNLDRLVGDVWAKAPDSASCG